jgi:hypothetical protein
MAEKNKEVVNETANVVKEVDTKETEKPKVEKLKVKKKKTIEPVDNITKIDLSKPPLQKSEEVEQQPTKEEEVVVVNEDPKEEPETVKEQEVVEQKEDIPVIQEVTDEEPTEEDIKEEIEEAVTEAEITGEPLPENIQKVVDFMNETGGDLSDYVNLNRDVSKLDDSEVLDEYYRTTKSHLSPEERNFLLEDSFGYDEDEDDSKEIRKKKIALKEQVAEARAYLDRQKSKYYEDIKAGSKLTKEQQDAINFFNTYQQEEENQKKLTKKSKDAFLKKTNNVFNEKFKGFDYQIGDKKFRFNVKDVDKVKTTQSDINNFIDKFVDKDKTTIEDAKGYHKSLFTAMNADAIAKHFYEQGKADAIKNTVAKDKNINMDPRKTHGKTETGGLKFKVLGDSADDFKFKIKRKK